MSLFSLYTLVPSTLFLYGTIVSEKCVHTESTGKSILEQTASQFTGPGEVTVTGSRTSVLAVLIQALLRDSNAKQKLGFLLMLAQGVVLGVFDKQ